LMKVYKQKYYVEKKPQVVRESFRRLGRTFRNVKKEKKIFLFLLAFFFYIDGVYTIIDMATAYGSALGLDTTGLLLALLVTQIVAFPFAILFGRLAKKYSADILITICIGAYFGIAVFAYFLVNQIQFFTLAVLVGMFQGGIQALSRSYFTKIIPAAQAGEYFGLLDICGKGAAFMGTGIVSAVTQVTGSMNKGVGAIAVLFVIGLLFFRLSVKAQVTR
ncbi:MAG: MFS transporter, partial [Lachnospiraceae bacterium]